MVLEVHPLTPERFGDIEALFGKNGAWGGCWCMWWKRNTKEFEATKGEPNRLALREACAERPPGLIGYVAGKPAGWVAIEPKEAYPRLLRSRQLKAVDESPAWAVTCFYIGRGARRTGLTGQLLEAAVAWAKENGASLVEGYPSEVKGDYMGKPATFLRAGFEEVSGQRGKRVVMRRWLG